MTRDELVSFIKDNKNKRFNIVLSNGVTMNKVGFFLHNNLTPCYMTSRQKRQGFVVPSSWDITSFEEVKKPTYTHEGNAQSILNRIHKNSWDCLRKELQAVINEQKITNNFEWHFTEKLNFRNIKSLLTDHELNSLKLAFENKTTFNWSRSANSAKGRDLSISTKLGKDNIFRAWFSSEYQGCLNGDYYLLLNPTTAIFYEKD